MRHVGQNLFFLSVDEESIAQQNLKVAEWKLELPSSGFWDNSLLLRDTKQ